MRRKAGCQRSGTRTCSTSLKPTVGFRKCHAKLGPWAKSCRRSSTRNGDTELVRCVPASRFPHRPVAPKWVRMRRTG
ncbi:hypothetical protein ACFPRL_10135 [Pseudoclavibacter helvolus]